MSKKVFVSGCFDMLHSGHVAFLQEAANYGDLHVCLGSDKTVHELKGRYPVYTQDERKYMIEALRCVTECKVSRGSGLMDFVEELEEIVPDIFVVNEDGNTPAKLDLCKRKKIEYVVLKRIPHAELPVRSTTSLRTECEIPYRIDLAGGWLDQPFVSKYAPGPVLTISIEPSMEFNDRSGMASSTRKRAIELWKTTIPSGDMEHHAKVLFGYENAPGAKIIAGSQDALGIMLPGLNKLNYDGGYWPSSIESVHDEAILTLLESNLYLVTLGPRVGDFDVLKNTDINTPNAQALALAAEGCWTSIYARDIKKFGQHFRESFEAQVKMFPGMLTDALRQSIAAYSSRAHGWKVSGAGGGGYLILVSDTEIAGAMKIKIRRQVRD
jgi:cytidyltransferase-like protein